MRVVARARAHGVSLSHTVMRVCVRPMRVCVRARVCVRVNVCVHIYIDTDQGGSLDVVVRVHTQLPEHAIDPSRTLILRLRQEEIL